MLTLAIALVLSSIEFPEFLGDFVRSVRPDLALLICYYWATNPTSRIPLVIPWAIGFFFDALRAEPLGLNGLIYCMVVYIGMNVPTRSNKTIEVLRISILVITVLLCEFARYGVSQFTDFPVDKAIETVLLTTIGTCAVWFLVVLLLNQILHTERTNVSFF